MWCERRDKGVFVCKFKVCSEFFLWGKTEEQLEFVENVAKLSIVAASWPENEHEERKWISIREEAVPFIVQALCEENVMWAKI